MAQHTFPPPNPDHESAATGDEQDGLSVDAGLVARALHGDSDAFATLFDRHAPRVYALAYRIAGREVEAEDITQDAFLHALNALPTLRRGEAFGAWVARIATNLAWAVLRQRMRLPQAELTEAVTETHPDTARWGSPEAMGLASEDQHAVRATLDRLAPSHRAALAMREIGGLSYADIAASLGTTTGSVEVLLFRARARFRDEYRKVALGATALPAMNCRRTPHVLAALADRQGSVEDRARAAAHARRCNACGAALQGQKDARKLLVGLPLAVPPAIKAAVLSKAAPLLVSYAGSAAVTAETIGAITTAGTVAGATGAAGAGGATSASILAAVSAGGVAAKIAIVAAAGIIVTTVAAAVVITHRPSHHPSLATAHTTHRTTTVTPAASATSQGRTPSTPGAAGGGHAAAGIAGRVSPIAGALAAATRRAGAPATLATLGPRGVLPTRTPSSTSTPTPTLTTGGAGVGRRGAGAGGTSAGAGAAPPRAASTATTATTGPRAVTGPIAPVATGAIGPVAVAASVASPLSAPVVSQRTRAAGDEGHTVSPGGARSAAVTAADRAPTPTTTVLAGGTATAPAPTASGSSSGATPVTVASSTTPVATLAGRLIRGAGPSATSPATPTSAIIVAPAVPERAATLTPASPAPHNTLVLASPVPIKQTEQASARARATSTAQRWATPAGAIQTPVRTAPPAPTTAPHARSPRPVSESTPVVALVSGKAKVPGYHFAGPSPTDGPAPVVLPPAVVIPAVGSTPPAGVAPIGPITLGRARATATALSADAVGTVTAGGLAAPTFVATFVPAAASTAIPAALTAAAVPMPSVSPDDPAHIVATLTAVAPPTPPNGPVGTPIATIGPLGTPTILSIVPLPPLLPTVSGVPLPTAPGVPTDAPTPAASGVLAPPTTPALPTVPVVPVPSDSAVPTGVPTGVPTLGVPTLGVPTATPVTALTAVASAIPTLDAPLTPPAATPTSTETAVSSPPTETALPTGTASPTGTNEVSPTATPTTGTAVTTPTATGTATPASTPTLPLLVTTATGTPVVTATATPLAATATRTAMVTATATATATTPKFSVNLDIGAVGLAGSVTYAGDTLSVRGSGGGIEGSVDAFHYVNLPLVGDGQIVARLVSQDGVNAAAKAGLMIRGALDASSPFAGILLTPGNGAVFQSRASTAARAVDTALSGVKAPYWIKLARNGAVLTGYVSRDGVTWTQVGSGTVALPRARFGPSSPLVIDGPRERAFFIAGGGVTLLDLRRGALVSVASTGGGVGTLVEDARTGHVFTTTLGPMRTVITGARNSSARTSAPAGIGNLQMLDARGGVILRTMPIGPATTGVAVDERRGRVYVLSVGFTDAHNGYTRPGTLSVVDERRGQVVRTLAVGAVPITLALDRRHDRLLVECIGAFGGTPDDPWGWMPGPVRRLLPFLPRPPAPVRTPQGSVMILDTARL